MSKTMTPKQAFLHDISLLMGKLWTEAHEKMIGELWEYSMHKQLDVLQHQIDAMKLQIKRLDDMVGRS